jgi:hypothetical protein
MNCAVDVGPAAECPAGEDKSFLTGFFKTSEDKEKRTSFFPIEKIKINEPDNPSKRVILPHTIVPEGAPTDTFCNLFF